MSEATETSMNRRKLLETAGVTAAFTVAGLARPAAAADPPAPIPFQWTVTGKVDALVIPFDQAVLSVRSIMTGTSDLLGGVITATMAHFAHLDRMGQLHRFQNGVAAVAGPGGDAIFVQYDGWGNPAPLTFRFNFTIVGGRGRYAGASGTGSYQVVVDPAKSEGTAVWEGVIVPCR